MTPKEKAKELVRKYYTFGIRKEGQTLSWYECKQCALISVDEILNTMHNEDFGGHVCDEIGAGDYWREVKAIIENL